MRKMAAGATKKLQEQGGDGAGDALSRKRNQQSQSMPFFASSYPVALRLVF
jgi:hypothetical protein